MTEARINGTALEKIKFLEENCLSSPDLFVTHSGTLATIFITDTVKVLLSPDGDWTIEQYGK